METVLQELIKYFEQQLSLQRESNIKYTGEEAFFDALEVCKNAFKTKEKQQIIDAYNQGYRDGEDAEESTKALVDVSEWADAELYYKKTFALKAVAKGIS